MAREPRFINHPRFHTEKCFFPPRKHLPNSKPIPQFGFTNDLALIGGSSSIKIYYKTFSNL